MDRRHTKKSKGPARIVAGIRSNGPKPTSGKNSKTQPKIATLLKKVGGEQPQSFKKVDLNKVKFKQLNNNKRELSMDEINKVCSSQSQFICMGHEPNIRLGAPVGLNKKHTRIYSLEGKPRAYIFASSNLHIWPMPTFTNEDVATALFDTHDPKVGKLVLCSFYWDILEKEIPDMFKKVT